MTYCDKSVLAPYCGNVKCKECTNAERLESRADYEESESQRNIRLGGSVEGDKKDCYHCKCMNLNGSCSNRHYLDKDCTCPRPPLQIVTAQEGNREELDKVIDLNFTGSVNGGWSHLNGYDRQRIKSFISQLLLDQGKKYQELIMAVESKFLNETRHETALRYIKQAEIGDLQAKSLTK